VLAARCEARLGSRSAWRASGRGLSHRLAETGGGVIGDALELLEPGHAQRAPAVEPRPVEVEALAVVARLGTQLLQSLGFTVGHGR
jgi:hypothetical protein